MFLDRLMRAPAPDLPPLPSLLLSCTAPAPADPDGWKDMARFRMSMADAPPTIKP